MTPRRFGRRFHRAAFAVAAVAAAALTGPRQATAQDALARPVSAEQAPEPRSSPVGIRARIDQLVLPGTELEARPVDRDAPMMVRVLKVWPHGSMFRYDLEWVGFEPGEYDLAQLLQRRVQPDAAPGDDVPLPRIPVVVTSQLAPNRLEPNDLAPSPPPDIGGYQTLQIAVGVAWGLGLLAVLFVGRRRKKVQAVAALPQVTLADRLRPLVEDAAAGRLDEAGKARLERLLLAWWRKRAGLGERSAADAIVELKRHPQAGLLLRRLEEWLHMPEPRQTVDVAALLEPYRDVSADDLGDLDERVDPGREVTG